MYNLNEFSKLMALCNEAKISYTVRSLFDGLQIKTDFDDAVIHFGSHGNEQGLLESYHAHDCEGYETAEEIFAIWKEWAKR